jgi:hypothetical protein
MAKGEKNGEQMNEVMMPGQQKDRNNDLKSN